MGKITRLVVCGASKTGKTSILEHLIYGEHACSVQYKTIEDTYLAQIDTDRGVKETVKIQDTGGADWMNATTFPRHYFHFGDGFVLVYNVTDKDSFKCVEVIKKEIEKAREKKDISIVVIGNKCDLEGEKVVDTNFAQNWATKEKVKLFETCISKHKQLAEPFIHLCSKMTQPPVKSTLLGSRRMKQQSID
uniref:NF-kappa-B inhibitor-interacting Ras-like protein 2 n=1 Tax=Phallusia mammillata TaxID=59560 RepID=A0A6F9DLL9_9ASCI|nr:NF-kappa-B inhibitor-interacting Ras-like protein 2 [Phallusia mammillata]